MYYLYSSTTAKIGDVINYKVTTYIPTYGSDVTKDSLKFYLYDTFSNGITYNDDVKVYISKKQNELGTQITEGFTTDKTAKADATFEINLDADTILNNQGCYVTLVYSGTLNENAKVNSADGNTNRIDLIYTNSPDNGEDHLYDTVKTYSFGLGVKKVDKASGDLLDGAKFELHYKDGSAVQLVKIDDNTYRVAKDDDTDTTTLIEVNSKSGHNPVIKGLNEGEYTLHETVAPDSYSKVSDIIVTIKAKKDESGRLTGAADISVSGGKTQQGNEAADDKVKVTATNGTIDINVYVEDTKGISLPETGSKTAMYCLFGGALLVVLGGAFIGLTNRKKVR